MSDRTLFIFAIVSALALMVPESFLVRIVAFMVFASSVFELGLRQGTWEAENLDKFDMLDSYGGSDE